jgi:hypothetical protein
MWTVIHMQFPTIFWIGKRTTSLLLNAHNVSDVRQIEIHTTEPLVPEPSPSRLKLLLQNWIGSIWNKEKEPVQWKKSIILPVHKKVNKTDCSNYRGISLLSTSYNILSNILVWWLSPYIDEIIGDQCGFRRNRSTTVQIFYIRHILGEK